MKPFEEEYVLVNGIEHFLLHYPKAADAPVLLYLHGGPGSVESIFAYEADKSWGDLVTFMRIMKVNHPLHLQLFTFHLNDFPPHYKTPVHYILGAADNITPTSLGKAYYETMDAPCKTFTTIPGAGHNPMYERPEEFTAALCAVRETLAV